MIYDNAFLFHRRGLKEFQFWLLTDRLLYGEPSPVAVNQFTLNRDIALSTCCVRSIETAVYSQDFLFVVESPAKSFIVKTRYFYLFQCNFFLYNLNVFLPPVFVLQNCFLTSTTVVFIN